MVGTFFFFLIYKVIEFGDHNLSINKISIGIVFSKSETNIVTPIWMKINGESR